MMDPEDEQRKRLLIYFKDCVEYKFLQSFFEDLNVDEDHENRAKDELDVEKIQNEEEVNMFEFDQHQDYEWDDTGHLYWYFLDDYNPCVSDCELMSHHTLEMQTNEAMGECLGSHDGATETVNVTESELSTTEVTVEPDPVLAVPLRDSLPDDMDSDNMELSQLQMQLPLTKLYYSLDPASGTASDLVQVSVRKCLSASALLGTEMYVSTYPFVMAAAAPTVAIFLLVYCEASTTGMLLYEPDPLWLDLVALAYTLDNCTAALKLLLDGPKLVLHSIKVTDLAKAHLALLVANNYEIGSICIYNRYHKFNVRSLVSASLALLPMLYVANVTHGRTLFMSQHMLLTYLFAMAASVGVFLLVYNKLIFATSGVYLKLLASACFTLQMVLYTAIMVFFTVLLLPLLRLDTGTVLKGYYDLFISTSLMYATDTIIAPYHVDWGARNFYFENLAVVASLYLFNEDLADVTVPLPLQNIVSEAKSPFVLVEVDPDTCQLLLVFLASVLTTVLYFSHHRSDLCTLGNHDQVNLPLLHHGYWDAPLDSAEHTVSKLFGPDLGTFTDPVQVDTNVMLLPAFSYVDVTICAYSKYDPDLLLHEYPHDPGDQALDFPAAVLHELKMGLGPLGKQVDLTLLHHHEYLGHVLANYVLYPVLKTSRVSGDQFHFGNPVFAPNLYTSAMLFPFVDLLTSPYVEVSLLLAFSHNCAALYFVDEVDLTQLHQGYPAFMLLTNALYVADYSEISELAQLSSKLTSPPLLHGLDMDQGCEANLSTIDSQDHADVVLLSCLRYRGH